MCSIVLAYRRVEGSKLVVAANRDERLDRAASGPRRWEGEPFVAPRDDVAGGSWLGVTRGGMFVGVTNRFGVPKDPARASRGELVVEALRAPSASALRASLDALSPARFNAFHLVYADADDAFVTWSDGDRVTHERLAPGVHVVTERSFEEGSPRLLDGFPIRIGDGRAREARLRAATEAAIAGAPSRLRGALEAMLRVHDDEDPLGATCIHLPALGYGTRSSFVLLGGETPSRARLFWAEGAPCTHPHVERAELVASLAEG